MLKRVVRMFISDAIGAPRRVRDVALPVGLDPYALTGRQQPKRVALGSAVWTGAMKSIVDTRLDDLEKLVTSVGPSPVLIDAGRLWVGGMTSLMHNAAQDPGPGERVDAGAVLDAAGDLLELLEEIAGRGATPIGLAAISVKDALRSAIRRVRDAAGKVSGTTSAPTSARVNDSGTLAKLLNGARAVNEAANARNHGLRETGFWGGGSGATSRAIGDSSPSTRVRDLVAQANRMPPSRERNELLAAAGRAQWSGG